MSVASAGTALIFTGTTTVTGPVDVDGLKNSATTSFAITKGSNEIVSGGAGAGAHVPVKFRSASGFTVTVVGGGSVTLYLNRYPSS